MKASLSIFSFDVAIENRMSGQMKLGSVRGKAIRVGDYMIADPEVCFGKLTFTGTRLPVETILTFLAMGRSIEYVLSSWPLLKREAVEEAVRLASSAWPDLMQTEFAAPLQKLAMSLQEPGGNGPIPVLKNGLRNWREASRS